MSEQMNIQKVVELLETMFKDCRYNAIDGRALQDSITFLENEMKKKMVGCVGCEHNNLVFDNECDLCIRFDDLFDNYTPKE